MKYKVGDKVVPINGSEAASLDSITSKMQEYNKKYLKVSKYASQGDRKYTICNIKGYYYDYYFQESDLIPYEEPKEYPKPFIIKYDNKHLGKAMEEELVKLGYVFHEDSRKYGEGIISNNAHPNRLRDSLSTYKELYIHKNEFHMGDIFNLPEQFSEALAYAKEAIESSIWNNDYKVGDWVVVMNYKQCGEGNAIIEPNLVTQLLSKDSGYKTIGMIDQEADFIVKQPNENNYCNIRKSHIIRKATPEEIAEATKPKETILILGDKGITVKITKEKIIAENKEIDYYALKGLVKTVEQISGGKISDWKVTISEIQRAIKIGCSFFSIQELKQVIEEYDKLNK